MDYGNGIHLTRSEQAHHLGEGVTIMECMDSGGEWADGEWAIFSVQRQRQPILSLDQMRLYALLQNNRRLLLKGSGSSNSRA